jgi:hypothetical protein
MNRATVLTNEINQIKKLQSCYPATSDSFLFYQTRIDSLTNELNIEEYEIIQSKKEISEINENTINNLINDILEQSIQELKIINATQIIDDTFPDWFNEFKNHACDKKNQIIKRRKTLFGAIIGDTQNQKTKNTLNGIKSLDCTTITFICTADRKDQNKQFVKRTKEQCPNSVVFNISDKRKNYDSIINALIGSKNIIVFFMNNSSQIKKINTLIFSIKNNIAFKNITDFLFCLDEGDATIQSDNTENHPFTKSELQWNELFYELEILPNVNTRCLFITATANSIYNNPRFVIKAQHFAFLQKGKNYRGYDDFVFHPITEDLILESLESELAIIKQNNEKRVILMCLKREKNFHMEYMAILISKFPNETIIIYNGDGIKIYTINNNLKRALLMGFEILYKNKEMNSGYNPLTNIHTFDSKISINTMLSICNYYNEFSPIIIGKDLFARGITVVSLLSKDNGRSPLSASTMFLFPGATCNQVSMVQASGRICGTSTNNELRIYCTTEVKESIDAWYINNKQICKNIKEDNLNKSTQEIISKMTFKNKGNHPIERPHVNKICKINFEKSQEYNHVDGEGFIDGVNLDNLHKWLQINSNLLISRMIRFLYNQNNSITLSQFKDGIKYIDNDESFKSNLKNGGSINGSYGYIWNWTDNKILMNKNIKAYITLQNLK